MIGKDGNFIKTHYDWLVAALAFAVLAAGGVMFFGSMGVDPAELAAEKVGDINRLPPGGEPVKAVDLADFIRVTKIAKSPTSLSEVTDDKGSFLASEARMSCTNCQAVVLKEVKQCPSCGVTLETVTVEDVDADQDGMPNDWEKRYGLNPSDPADANLDKDGDGFTNLEEFEAKTDPTDRESHPDYLDSLKLQLPLKETTLPFVFTGTYKTPSGLKYQFKDPNRAKEYDRGVYSVLAGDEIGTSGFVPEKYVPKTEEKAMGGGMKKKVDASEVIVVRKSDSKKVTMVINRRGVPVDVKATLVYGRDGGKTFDVVTGDVFELSGEKYAVKAITRASKGATVTVEQTKSEKKRTISALEP